MELGIDPNLLYCDLDQREATAERARYLTHCSQLEKEKKWKCPTCSHENEDNFSETDKGLFGFCKGKSASGLLFTR